MSTVATGRINGGHPSSSKARGTVSGDGRHGDWADGANRSRGDVALAGYGGRTVEFLITPIVLSIVPR